MIRIAGIEASPASIIAQYEPESIQAKIINRISISSIIYKYDSLDQLKFELNLRKSIIDAAVSLYKSKMSFKVFRKSMCNIDFWNRTQEGGFQLKQGVKPSDAINDIFNNGKLYGTECATAMVIIYYKAVLDLFAGELFDNIFPNIYLMDWYRLDRDLGVRSYDGIVDFLPGDGRYFKNPDVDPVTPQWQGENAIDLGNGTFYGHGIGIKTEEQIIKILNGLRKKGAAESAYLMDSVKWPNFKHLAKIFYNYAAESQTRFYGADWNYGNRRNIFFPIYLRKY